jgi:TRAP-type C4-dicarboxylate transport system substrate-binding protein
MTRLGAVIAALSVALAGAGLGSVPASAQERLLFTGLSPAGGGNSIFFNAWAKRVNDASNGALRIEVRDGTTLANYGNVYDRVLTDVVQIGWAIHQVIGGKFPLSEVAGLPFVSAGGPGASQALWRLHKSGMLDDEYKDIVPLIFVVFGPAQVHYGKAPRGIDDLGNVKVGVQGKVPSQLVSALGGTPISVQPGDMYEALQRGTVDASIISWSGFAPYKLQEVTTQHVEGSLGQSTSMFFMSRKRYDALPEAARKALEMVAAESTTKEFADHFNAQWLESRAPVAADAKHKINELSAAQNDKWQAAAAPIISEWAKGRHDGEKVLDAYKKLYADAMKR